MLFITSYCSTSQSIAVAVEELARHGFTNIELTGGTRYKEYRESDLHELRNKYGLKFLIHNFFPPQGKNFVLNLASVDEKTHAQTIDLVAQAVSLSRKFAQSLYSIHAGYAHDLTPAKGGNGLFLPRNNKKNSGETFLKSVEYIAASLLPDGFCLAVENAFPAYGDDSFSLLSTPSDIFAFLNRLRAYPNVGILLDLGHLNVAAYHAKFDKYQFLEKLIADYSHKIFELHVSANDRKSDDHDISAANSFEIQFVRNNISIFSSIPVVLEWHQNLSPSLYEQYRRIEEIIYS
jgi:sugar phosphate isomerase/epimerase